MTSSAPPTIVITERGGPGMLVRILWDIFIDDVPGLTRIDA